MSHFAAMTSPLPVAASALAGDAKSPLFCPKPRRPVAPLRCHQSGGYTDAGAGMDLLDLLLAKGEESSLSAASPQSPLFCGSPPRRASNPVVHDSRFGMDCPLMPMPMPMPALPVAAPVAVPRPTPRSAAPSMSPRSAAGCARARFALQPAAVRVEGFDCLDRSRGGRGHGITAMA
ncbi:uncharacterized protein LOC133904880 [Phragmites australis]|uniref:uncharacterized protein LOC133904880 n=1 Tax=Phragmites australis TaxID=29695 RepID=UPI002D7921F7|nr:uncharacterized protein LOC133904880 [Phragmites australis]